MARTVITLKGNPIVTEEKAALAAITPGHLLTLSATGVTPNVTAASKMAALFALERDELGNNVDVDYATGDTVKVGAFAAGQRVYAWLASGQTITEGAYLAGNTTAGLLTASADDDDIICQALESVDTSGVAPVTGTRIRVQIV